MRQSLPRKSLQQLNTLEYNREKYLARSRLIEIPAGGSVHTDAPVATTYLPTAHDMHAVNPAVEYVPATQGDETEAPVTET